MNMPRRFTLSGAALTAALALGGAAAQAQTKELTFAHQDMLVPLRLVMESGEVEKATGYKINWRMFSGGGDVIRAMASGDVQMGETGSSPLTAAASQGQDIKLFWISADIADAEALVARNASGITSLKDLKGKKVATPFVSTAHYQLMAGMKMEGVDPKTVNVMNARPRSPRPGSAATSTPPSFGTRCSRRSAPAARSSPPPAASASAARRPSRASW
jgi:taurine transport system substrate-binding protein